VKKTNPSIMPVTNQHDSFKSSPLPSGDFFPDLGEAKKPLVFVGPRSTPVISSLPLVILQVITFLHIFTCLIHYCKIAELEREHC